MTLSERLAVLEDFFLENGFAITDVTGSGTDYSERKVYFILRNAKTRREAGELSLDQKGRITIESAREEGIRKLLSRSGLNEYMRERPDHVVYRTKYTHKISPSERDIGPDVSLSPKHLEDETRLGAVLRAERVLGKGERVREYRVEPSGRVVVFPNKGIWHSIVLTPVK
jgi:hypothetical protein